MIIRGEKGTDGGGEGKKTGWVRTERKILLMKLLQLS